MYYETMERVLSKTDKTMVETQGVTSYLPLPELRRTRPVPHRRREVMNTFWQTHRTSVIAVAVAVVACSRR